VTAPAVTVGTDIPGTLWEAGQAAVEHETCTRCHAAPGQDCTSPGGVHTRRVVAARLDNLISEGDYARVMFWGRVYGDGSVIPTLGGQS
jgi:hypothetical protein